MLCLRACKEPRLKEVKTNYDFVTVNDCNKVPMIADANHYQNHESYLGLLPQDEG